LIGSATLPMTPYLSPPLAWSASGTTVAVASTTAYTIDVYRNARAALRITRALPQHRVTADDVRREAGDGMRMRGGTACHIPPEVLIRGRGAAEVAPSIAEITIDPTGRIWVWRWAPRGTGRLTDIFATDGTYEGTLPRGTAFPAFFATAERFVAVETDPDGIKTLALYDVSRQAR
jgi:hypothetical protein